MFKFGHALIIGTGTNEHGILSKNYESTINDAEWLGEVLKNPSLCSYPQDQVEVLCGIKATYNKISEALVRLEQRILDMDEDDENCTVVVFFSGHGTRRGDKTFLVPYGYQYDENSTDGMIDGDFLYKKLDAIKAGRVLLLLNSCYSGGVMATLGGDHDQDVFLSNEPLSSKQIDRLRRGKGFCFLSAAQASEKAYTAFKSKTTKKKYSPFTIGLSRGFSGVGGRNVDGFVRYGHLVTICSSYLGAVTKMKQTPHIDFKGDNFAVGCFTQGAAERYPMLSDDHRLEVGINKPDSDDDDYVPPKPAIRNKTVNIFSGTITAGGSILTGNNKFGDYANFSTTTTNYIRR